MEWWVIGLLLGVGAPLTAAAAGFVRRWLDRRGVASVIRDTPPAPISRVIDTAGMTAIQGNAHASSTMSCPFIDEPIIGLRVTIEFVQRGTSEQGEGTLRQSVDFTEMEPFEVVDDSGVALARGAPAVLLGAPHERDPHQFAVDLTDPWLNHRVQMEGFSNTDIVSAVDLSCSVRLLRPGSPVYVLGRPKREVDPGSSGESSYREPPMRLVMEPPDGGVLLVADCHHERLLESLQSRMQ